MRLPHSVQIQRARGLRAVRLRRHARAFTTAEIASELGITATNVLTRLFGARNKLREAYRVPSLLPHPTPALQRLPSIIRNCSGFGMPANTFSSLCSS